MSFAVYLSAEVERARAIGCQASHQSQYCTRRTATTPAGANASTDKACVAPIIEYASMVWHGPLRDKTHLRYLRTVQKAALIQIFSTFRTAATSTLEVKAHVLLTHLRLCHRAQTTIAKLHTLPRKHPI